MPRPKLIDRPRRLEIHVPSSLYDRLRTELYSEVEGRVPHGAFTELFGVLASRWLEDRGRQP